MRDESHNTSLLLPGIDVEPPLPDGLTGRLLQRSLVSGADIPETSHDPESTFTQLLTHNDWTRARCICPTWSFGLRAALKVEPAEEVFCISRPLAEPVDTVDVRL